MIVIMQMLNKNARAVCVLRKLIPDVTYVTNATSEQIKVSTALARACEVCILPNLGPSEAGPTSPVIALTLGLSYHWPGRSYTSMSTVNSRQRSLWFAMPNLICRCRDHNALFSLRFCGKVVRHKLHHYVINYTNKNSCYIAPKWV